MEFIKGTLFGTILGTTDLKKIIARQIKNFIFFKIFSKSYVIVALFLLSPYD